MSSSRFVSQFDKLSILDVKDEEYVGKKIFLRVDFNLPLKTNRELDDFRIRSTLPTIKFLLEKNVKCLVLVSHMSDNRKSLRRVFEVFLNVLKEPKQEEILKLIQGEVDFIENWSDGKKVLERIEKCDKREIIVLENVRFFKEEKEECKESDIPPNVNDFRKMLSSFGDIYVNDAFGTCHRPHSSMVGVSCQKNVAGFLVMKEIRCFQKALGIPKKPLVVICGGAKLKTKIPMIKHLLMVADEILIGGGMAYTFLKGTNRMSHIGRSLFDRDNVRFIPDYMKLADENNVKIHLPVDHIITNDFVKNDIVKTVTNEEGVDEGFMALDIGPETTKHFKSVIARANTVLWNGPLGVFGNKNFEAGTKQVLLEVAKGTKERGVTSVICGGDSATAASLFLGEGCKELLSHISTGGGASLALCEGCVLPGVFHLSSKTE